MCACVRSNVCVCHWVTAPDTHYALILSQSNLRAGIWIWMQKLEAVEGTGLQYRKRFPFKVRAVLTNQVRAGFGCMQLWNSLCAEQNRWKVLSKIDPLRMEKEVDATKILAVEETFCLGLLISSRWHSSIQTSPLISDHLRARTLIYPVGRLAEWYWLSNQCGNCYKGDGQGVYS